MEKYVCVKSIWNKTSEHKCKKFHWRFKKFLKVKLYHHIKKWMPNLFTTFMMIFFRNWNSKVQGPVSFLVSIGGCMLLLQPYFQSNFELKKLSTSVDTISPGAAAERVQQVHLHRSWWMIVHWRGLPCHNKGKKRDKLVLKKLYFSFLGGGVHSLRPWNCFGPNLLKPWLYPCSLIVPDFNSKSMGAIALLTQSIEGTG